jgi:ABC-type transporter Mla subunit MlaD
MPRSPARKKPRSAARKTAPAATIKVTPVRLEPSLRQGLLMLQGVLKKPLNKMVNQAVGEFIEKQAAEVESNLEALLQQIRDYRKRDPDFVEAIRETARAEAQAQARGQRDPAQGTIYEISEPERGPVQARLRELLERR